MDELIALSSYVSRVVPLPASAAADAFDAALAGLCPELAHEMEFCAFTERASALT